jgi:LacI family transcriptional regulator
MATIRDVAKLAKVSISTVSRVINGTCIVAAEKESKVLKAMAELGYKPNTFAQSLATNRSNSIGIIVGDMLGWFPGSMVQGVEKVIADTGLHLIVSSGHAKANTERQAIDFLIDRRCDALIVHIDALSDNELIEISKQYSTPIILINRYIHELRDHCVYLNNESGGQLATKYLVRQGHTKIACITGQLYKPDSRARLQGYRMILDHYHLPFREELVLESDYSEDGGFKTVNRLLERTNDFTAIFFGNDNMAIGGLNALKDAHFKVPEEISIIGFDNALMSRYITPKLSTIEMPITDMAEAAAQLALSFINKKKFYDIQQEYNPKLISRESIVKNN